MLHPLGPTEIEAAPGERGSYRTGDVWASFGPIETQPAEVTQAGTRFLTEFGIDLSALSSTRRRFCRLCLDWTERRPHIAGAVGAALTKRCFDLGWTERMKHSRAVTVTTLGKRGFLETFGIGVFEENDKLTGTRSHT